MKRETGHEPARPTRRVVVSEAQAAVDDYLDTLLFEATEVVAAVAIPVEAAVEAAVVSDFEPITTAPTTPSQQAKPQIRIEPQPDPVPSAEVVLPSELEQAPDPAPTKTEPALPDWAGAGFQCLQFDLGGWQLAAPLVGLQRILSQPGKLHRVPGAASWELGLCEHGEGRARVVNLSRLMGGSQKNDADFSSRAHLLLLADGYWACLCDRIGEVSWLSASDIQWAVRDERRPWEVGVVRDSLRTLVDPARLARQLSGGISAR